MPTRDDDPQLTAREMLIAKTAAEIAVKTMTDDFYQSVGRTVINRIFIVVGAVFVGFAYGKGWLNLSNFFKG